MTPVKKVFTFSFLLLFCLPLLSQIPGKLKFERFEKAHEYGIPGVYCMFEDTLGVIWFGSTNGIYRYNGADILEFKGGEKKILGKTNYNFYQEKNGDVLIGSDYGICRYHLKENKVELLLHINTAFDERNKYCIIGYDHDRYLWLSITGSGIARFKNKLEFIKDPQNGGDQKPDRLLQGYIDLKNNKAYLTNHYNSSLEIDLKTLHFKKIESPFFDAIKKIDRRLFFIYKDRIVTVDQVNGKEKIYLFPKEQKNKIGQQYSRTSVVNDSCLWISGMSGILSFNFKRNYFESCFGFENDTKSPWLKLISELFTDKCGNTWICSETDGIRIFNQLKQKRFQFTDGSQKINTTIMDVEPINDTLLLVCPLVNKPCLFNLTTNATVPFHSETFESAQTFSSDKINDSTCLLTSPTGKAFLFHYQSCRLTAARYSLKNFIFSKVLVSKYNSGYFISGNLLYAFNFTGGIFQLRAAVRLDVTGSFNLLRDPLSHKLIVSARDYCLLINDSGFQIPKRTEPLFGAFNGYEYARDGSLWLATRHGLKHYDPQYKLLEIFNTDSGLNNDVIYDLLYNKDSSALFLSTNMGISRLELKSRKIINYTTADGIEESEHNTGASAKGLANTYYFGNINGVTFFREDNLQTKARRPFIIVDAILINQKNYKNHLHPQFIDSIFLKPDSGSFSVRYSLFNSSEPEKIRYTYSFEKTDHSWETNGSSAFINYSGLNPGEYLLTLRGCVDNDCIEKKIRVFVSTPFYRTWWFLLFLAFSGCFIFIFLVSVITKARVRRKEKKFETERKLLEQKNRISRDLHDNVGARLSMMLNTMDWITKTKTFDETTFSELQDSTKSVIQNLRETIWVMNKEEITNVELFDKIKTYALQFFKHHHTNVIFHENIAANNPVNFEQTLNLFRITQEALNNILKYAKAGTIEIGITCDSETFFEISFADNGLGFDLDTYKAGNGIINMRERAEEIKAGFFIDSGIGKGTVIRIRLYSK